MHSAKEVGDVLLVGIESDARVRRIKGEGRPINSQDKRKHNLETLNIADSVFILPEAFDKPEHHLALLESLQPSILAISSHTPHVAEKEALMKKIGGKVLVVREQNPAISTTKLLEQGDNC